MPNKDGDPSEGDIVTEEFEFGKDNKPSGETIKEAPAETTAGSKAEIPSAEASNAEALEIKPPDGQGSKDTTGQEKKELSEREQALHHQALGIVGSVLSWGDKDAVRSFFRDNPDLAEVANGSKKYKDDYRSLVKEVPEKKEDDDIEVVDEDRLTARIMANATQQGLRAERKVQAETFAGKNNINADNFDLLFETAEAIRKTSNLSFEKCLHGAKEALRSSAKSGSIEKPRSGSVSDTGKEGDANKEAEIGRMMKEYSIDRTRAEKLYARTAKIDSKGWLEMM